MPTDKNWRLLGQGLAVLTLTAALAACGGSSDASSSDSGAAAASASVASVSPSVSGTPPTMVAADNRYSFLPTVANATGTPLSFSIQNKPAWASFGLATGELSGTPSAPDAGTYPNIVIAASDGNPAPRAEHQGRPAGRQRLRSSNAPLGFTAPLTVGEDQIALLTRGGGRIPSHDALHNQRIIASPSHDGL